MAECFLDAEEVEGSIPSAPTIDMVCEKSVLKGVCVQKKDRKIRPLAFPVEC